MVHFIHTSDWHLGYVQYHRKERFSDYFYTANKVIERIIELHPDFVLHTGDLFHHTRPSPGTIRLTIKLLKKLQVAGTPIYIIRGNHDARSTTAMQYGGTAMKLLEDIGLLHYVQDTTVQISKDIILTGIGYYIGNKTKRLISENIQENSTAFSIFALHNYVEGQIKDLFDISMNQLAELQYNYIAVGHYHIPWAREEYNVWVPGSSEATSSNDWRRPDLENGISLYSSFYNVVAEKTNTNWQLDVTEEKIVVRPKILLEMQSIAQTGEELEMEIKEHVLKRITIIEEKLGDSLPPEKKRPILQLTIQTDLPQTEIAKFSIENLQEELNLLHANISIESQLVQQLEQNAEIRSLQISKILQELATEHPIESDNLADTVATFIELLSNRPKNREFKNEELDSLIKIVEGIK